MGTTDNTNINIPPWPTYEIIKKDWYNHRCLHDACTQCHGTGRNQLTGGACIHMISCPCPKCTPYC